MESLTMPSSRKKQRTAERQRVTFAANLETVHRVETYFENSESVFENTQASSVAPASQLTEEITVLSSEHGRARRELREVPKICLQSAVKHGIKTSGHPDPRTGLPRWKYTFGNVIYVTDHTSGMEVTCYKESVSIMAAPISNEMIERHQYVKRIINEEPHMCTSHFVVIVDQSGSMKKSDVNAFRNRSQAAYGCLALDCVAEQLVQVDDSMNAGIDTFTLIEMNDDATIIFDREPFDWILFNKILKRQTESKPRSHGNYGPSIETAKKIIRQELDKLEGVDEEDLPGFALILLSDGKPSDTDDYDKSIRISNIIDLCQALKDKMRFFGMGIGADGTDFSELKCLSDTANIYGGNGEFNHAGLSAANLGDGFSTIASSMSTMRSGLLSKSDDEAQKYDEAKPIVPLKERQSFTKSIDESFKVLRDVSRCKLNLKQWEEDRNNDNTWYVVPMINNKKATGFAMDNVAFGKGTERLAYRFQEVDCTGKLIGKLLVAKETKGVHDERKKFGFHEHFCRIQITAAVFAEQFNHATRKTPSLKPKDPDDPMPPTIEFTKCSVYEYKNRVGEQAGILVENYLKGRFIKYNSNNGYVNAQEIKNSSTIDLEGGEANLTDFIHAFSHWTYVNSHQRMLLCDLQGVLDQEGRRPIFKLTDPAICTTKTKKGKPLRRYGRTDKHWQGVRLFFKSHRCNIVCKCLGLPGSEY